VLAAQGQDVEMGEDDPTQGAPGWYLNQSAAQRAAVKGMARGVMPTNTLPGLVPMMMHHVAGLPQSLKAAQVYKTLAEMQAKQEGLNLPQTMVNDAALNEVAQLWAAIGYAPTETQHEGYGDVD
jgi:hypothetical protein